MYWNSFTDFFLMGAHGAYVWGSFGVMAIAMVLEPLLVARSRNRLVVRLTRQMRAERAEQAGMTGLSPHFSKGSQ